MGELIGAITNLCKLLECLVSISLKPDYFRLSKLNKLESEQLHQVWEVSHKICCFSTNTYCTNDSYKCIEHYLRRKGGVTAYFLSPDVTPRQLLLCLGFLLSEGIIENNINKVLLETPLGEELPSFMVKPYNDEDILERPDQDDSQVMLNYVTFVSQKVQHNLRAIGNYSQEKVQLFSKIHKARSGAHLAAADLLMTVQPELQQEFLAKCQHCIPLLKSYSKWHRKRHVFWEWMGSVVEEEIKSKSCQQSVAEISHLHDYLRKLRSDVHKTQMTEGENLDTSEYCYMPVTSRRMYHSENGETLDSIIENTSLEINNLEKGNKKKLEKIKMNLSNAGDENVMMKSILKVLSDFQTV